MTDHDMYAELAADILDLVSRRWQDNLGAEYRAPRDTITYDVDEEAKELVREWVDENLSGMTLQMVEKMLLSDEFIRALAAGIISSPMPSTIQTAEPYHPNSVYVACNHPEIDKPPTKQ